MMSDQEDYPPFPQEEYPTETIEPTPTVTDSDYPAFAAAVRARIFTVLGDLDEIDPSYLEEFSTNFSLAVDAMLQKYRQGQLEHGGNLLDRDLAHERTQEIRDLFIYDLAERSLKGAKASVKV